MIRSNVLALGSAVVITACGGRPAEAPAPLQVDPRCAAMSDTLSKYVSSDALPEAAFSGDTRALRSAAPLRAGETISVSLLVRPDGTVDPGFTEIAGANDPAFELSVAAFAQSNRFVPGQLNGCNVLSRYTLVLR